MNLTIGLLFYLFFSINSFAGNYDEAKSIRLRNQICQFKAENLNEIHTLIIDSKVDVNYGSYESPIICTAYKLPKEFQHEVLKALLARADINLKFITSTNPLTLFMNRYPSEADPNAIDLLMADQRFDPNMPPNWDNEVDPNYPLAVVLRKGTLEQAKFLLSYVRINPNGVDVIRKNVITRTALYVASTSKINAIEKMHLLKERSEFILNPVGWYDRTVLMELARNNTVPQEIFETLVTDFGHDVNQATPEGHSALFSASSPVAMRFFLSLSHTDLNAKDRNGDSVLYTHLRYYDETAALLAASPRVNLGTAESYEDRNAENPIADAAWFGALKALEVLLNRPESSAMLNHGEVLNAIRGRDEILRRLIQDPRVNINFNKRVDPGWDSPPMVRPLFYALAERKAEAIKILATRPDLDLDFEKAENAEHLLVAMNKGNQLVGGGYREDGGPRCKEPYLQEFLKAFEALKSLPKFNINYRCNQLLEDLANQDCIVSPLQIEALISDSRFRYSPNCKFSDSDGKLKKRDLHFNLARRAELIGLETVFKHFPPLSPNMRDEEGNTLLMAVLSSRNWRPPVFEYVFKHYGKEALNVKNNKAETPLIVATKQHAVLAIEMLVSMPEVDLCARDNEGKTAEDADNDHYHRRTGLITEELKKRGISCKE